MESLPTRQGYGANLVKSFASRPRRLLARAEKAPKGRSAVPSIFPVP